VKTFSRYEINIVG